MKNKIIEIFKFMNVEIKKYSKIDTFVNKLYKVDTNKGNFFLKIYETKEEERVGFKLSNLYPLLLKEKIPVPKIIKYDSSLTLINYPYLIMTEIKGEMLWDKIDTMSEKDKLSFYYDFGKVLSKLHLITFDQFGETFNCIDVTSFVEANNKGPFKSWKEMHKEIVEYRLSYLKGTYFDNLITQIKKYFNSNSNLIDYDIVPRLLHIDLNQKNIFIKDNKISGIIDFDGAFIGHNEEELMRTEGANFSTQPKLKESFFNGYTENINLDEGYEKRRTFYYLSRLLVHIDCIIEYGQNYIDNVEVEQKLLRKEINDILKGKSIKFDRNSP
jgi:fructosamine-3-kinase